MSKRVVLGVTGSIAAYRAAELASTLTKEGVEVDVVLTDEALRFITALTFNALTRRDVYTRENDGMRDGQPAHVSLADHADLVVVAPATAHLIAQMAHGLAPDLLTSLLLATPAPVIVAPAMNGKMWHHAATQDNVNLLRKRGVSFIGPEAGLLACGYEGLGRLWPVADIAREIFARLKNTTAPKSEGEEENKKLVCECWEVIRQEKKASTSNLQRRLKIGYERAAYVIDCLEKLGVIGPADGVKPREILVDLESFSLKL